jgi:hypothetical protein
MDRNDPLDRSGSLDLRSHLETKRIQRDKTGGIRLVIGLGEKTTRKIKQKRVRLKGQADMDSGLEGRPI